MLRNQPEAKQAQVHENTKPSGTGQNTEGQPQKIPGQANPSGPSLLPRGECKSPSQAFPTASPGVATCSLHSPRTQYRPMKTLISSWHFSSKSPCTSNDKNFVFNWIWVGMGGQRQETQHSTVYCCKAPLKAKEPCGKRQEELDVGGSLLQSTSFLPSSTSPIPSTFPLTTETNNLLIFPASSSL